MVDVHLDGVEKVYGGVPALDDVDLDVADGEFFTLVGPSGCGKTTTLRTIAGFETPTAGSVRFGDRDVSGVPPEERDVGIVFQNYALFPHMSVAENVAYGLRFREPPGRQTKRERVDELLALVDLPGFGDRDPDQLSGGQQQRVALARALAPGPELLLLDEPMSALDARLRERLRIQVKRIQSELGVTTVYVTHDQEEALAVSDRVAVMNDGRVEQVGTPKEVYRRPASRFVASFVGDNNLFDGRVAGHDGETTRVSVDGTEFAVPRRDGRRPKGDEPLDGDDPSDGGELVFCVRPEVLADADGQANQFTASVEAVEFLGETFRIHLAWNGRELVCYADEEPDGDRLALGFEPEDAHVIG